MDLKIINPDKSKTFEQFGYAAVGHCIYCHDKLSQFSNEHIIGKAINGNITLPKSSCPSCSRITGKIEGFCFDGHMRGFRRAEGFRTTEKPPYKEHRTERGTERRYTVESNRSSAFAYLNLPKLAPPKKLIPHEHKLGSSKPWIMVTGQGLPSDGDWNNFGPYSATNYARMLAKIAHSYCTAEMLKHHFRPLLNELILNESLEIFNFVGTKDGWDAPETPKEPLLHRLSLECWETSLARYIIVNIRLFAYMGAPEYHVIAGLTDDMPVTVLSRIYRSSIPQGSRMKL
jgi:hypothetical protein